MTKEQKEAIDRLKELVELRKSKNKIKYDNCICATSDVDIVLNLIKKQEKEIEKYKKLYQKALDDAVVTAHDDMQKDKIIDELAKAFKQDDARSVEEIKQFYERKVENEEN